MSLADKVKAARELQEYINILQAKVDVLKDDMYNNNNYNFWK